MAKRLLVKVVAAVCAITTIATVSGVSANWLYAEKAVSNSSNITVEFGEWKPEVSLPEDDEAGKNHLALIQALVGADIGLNNSNSYLSQQIKRRKNGIFIIEPKRDTLGNMGANQDDRLNELFDKSSTNLNFLIHFVNSSTYHIYTMGMLTVGERDGLSENDSNYRTPLYAIGAEYVPEVWRTVVNYTTDPADGKKKWIAETSQEGYALSAYYEESRSDIHKTKIPCINPDTWQAGHLQETT